MTPDPFDICLQSMRDNYAEDPVKAVRSQRFIKILHEYVAHNVQLRLSNLAVRDKVEVKKEATLFGSHKPKNADVSVIHPNNGPLMIIGLRSQMSSIGKNVLNYYQDVVGECISLQDRFPLAVIGYVYLMPYRSILEGHEDVVIDHQRYAKLYAAISGRGGHDYRTIRGVYDHFAYMIVDFASDPPALRDDLLEGATRDLSIHTFVERMVTTYKERNLFLDYFV